MVGEDDDALGLGRQLHLLEAGGGERGPDRQPWAGRHDGEACLDALAEPEHAMGADRRQAHRATADLAHHHARLGDIGLADRLAILLEIGAMERDRPRRRHHGPARSSPDSRPWSRSSSGRDGTAGRRRAARPGRGPGGSARRACRRSAPRAPARSRSRASCRARLARRRRLLPRRCLARPTDTRRSLGEQQAPDRPVPCSSVLNGPPPCAPSKSCQSPACSPASMITQDPDGAAAHPGCWPAAIHRPGAAPIGEQPRHPGMGGVAQAGADGVQVVADGGCRRRGVVQVNQGSPTRVPRA